MQYTIDGFSQQRLCELGLKTDHAVFLRWFVDWIASGTMESRKIEGVVYHWVQHKKVIAELPILGMENARSVNRLTLRLVESGVLLKHVAHSLKGKAGQYTYYATGPEYVGLIDTGNQTVTSHVTELRRGSLPKRAYKDSSTIDSSTKDSIGADAPAKKAKEPTPMKDALEREIDETFLAHGDYPAFGKERGMVKRICQLATRDNPDNPRGKAMAMVHGFRWLIDNNPHEYWATAPYLPSELVTRWRRVESMMRGEVGKRKAGKEIEEKSRQLAEAGW